MVTLSRHINSPPSYKLDIPGRATLQDKIYVGFVKYVDDANRMGRLKVWIPELSGDPNDETGWFIVSYCTPFAGATDVQVNKNDNTFIGTQKSYGMWFVPPDINNEVVCAFINGDPARGIWFGCLYQQNMNHMVPGIPGQNSTASTPVSEYNKKVTHTNQEVPDRPVYSPLADSLVKQGLDQDILRGVSDSGARRSNPSMEVYGILTPGGSQMVFDDNPSNTFIRFRTKNGAQLIINDTTGFIYLNSVDGKNWVSMDAGGKIDIYAYDDISIRTQGSMNLRADRDVNIEAGQNINMKARGNTVTTPIANPQSGAVPQTTTPGPTSVIGDSIAVGVGSRIDGSTNFASVGDNSTEIWNKLQTNESLKNLANSVLSVGSYDIVNGQGNITTLTENLNNIKDFLGTGNFIWLLPYDSVAKSTVKTFADSKGDQTIDLSNYPSSDNMNPRDYNVLANDIIEKLKPSQSSSGNTSTSTSTTTTGSTTIGSTPPTLGEPATSGTNYLDIVTPFLVRHEGKKNDSYWDPPNQRSIDKVSIGYGHQIKTGEYSQGYIDTATAGRIAITRPNPSNNPPAAGRATDDQCTALLRLDIPRYAGEVQRIIRGAWDQLGPYQQAALTSLCYNAGGGGIQDIVRNGGGSMMGSGDIEGVAKLIENTRPGWAGNPTGLRQRRLDEANMYRQRPDLVGQSGGTTEGSTLSGTTSGSEKASGSIAVADPNIQNGFIRIESRNSMHIISQQYLFLTSAKDMHRYVAGSIFDSAAQNVNRIAGGYVHESVNQEYTLSSGSSMAMFATRIDMNGTAPPLAIAAVAAIGPSEQAQADGILNSLGNVTPTLTDTIVYHLPFHEPYDDHGGRNFESLRNSTNINTDTGLRDGEVVPNSSKPLDIVGTPRSSMPAGMYMGAGYNNSNEPLYAYTGPTGNAALFPTSALQLSSSGVQFITSFENGSYRPIVVGNPPTSQIGYGHELTPTELSSGSVMINGTSKSLSQPLVQQDILDLFNQDMTAVQTWMRPVVNVAVTQTQYDMLCSLAFNIGEQNFKNSDSIKELNAGNLQKVPNLWMQHTVNGGGQLVPGLIIRRRAEVTQFMLAPKREVSASITSNISINTTSITVAPNH